MTLQELNRKIKKDIKCELRLEGNELNFKQGKKKLYIHICECDPCDMEQWKEGIAIFVFFENHEGDYYGYGSPFNPREMKELISYTNKIIKKEFSIEPTQLTLF